MKKSLSIVVILMMIISLFGGNAFGETYVDIDNDWAKEALEKAVDNGLLIGEGNLLRPDAYLTRAEMATIMNRMFGQSPSVDLATYTDVEKAAWYYDQMAMAVQKGFFLVMRTV